MPAGLQNAASELIRSGRPEKEIAEWLNETLARAAIKGMEPDVTQQNVSAWKKSGYKRWLENCKTKEIAARIAEIKETADPTKPDSADALASALIAELAIELVIKQNYEPGEERAKRLLEIVGGLVQLRRTNQAKGWLKIEVAKTRMSMTRLQNETGQEQQGLQEEEPKGLSGDTIAMIDEIMGTTTDPDHQYDTMSEQEANEIREKLREHAAILYGAVARQSATVDTEASASVAGGR